MAKVITETTDAAANDPGTAIEKLDENMTKLGEELETLHKQIIDAARVAREFADPRWSAIETRNYWQKSVVDMRATGSFDERRRNLNRWQPKAKTAEDELKTFGAHMLFQRTRDDLLVTILTSKDLSPVEKKTIIDYWGYDANEVPNYVLTTGD